MWRIRQFFACLKDEKGIGVVEVILILVVLIGLVIIFKRGRWTGRRSVRSMRRVSTVFGLSTTA